MTERFGWIQVKLAAIFFLHYFFPKETRLAQIFSLCPGNRCTLQSLFFLQSSPRRRRRRSSEAVGVSDAAVADEGRRAPHQSTDDLASGGREADRQLSLGWGRRHSQVRVRL